MSLRCGLALAALACLSSAPAALSAETCAAAPYQQATGDLAALVQRLEATLKPYPALARALREQAPDLCLDDSLVEEQGYFEPKTNRVVLNSRIPQDFQVAILIHEVRHLQQFIDGACPTVAYRMVDYIRSRLALEADAAAIGIYVAWHLRAEGDSGPWETLRTWPTHEDLVERFATTIEAGGDEVAATSAAFAKWFESSDRREMYTFAICSNYLDALDREKVLPGQQSLPDDFAAKLCVLPDGRPYDCVLPP